MLTVLVVEDSYEDMEYCCYLIQKIRPDCEILKAGNVEKAICIIKENDIDVFFLNVRLPGRNGLHLAGIIRNYKKYLFTPIVFMTVTQINPVKIHRQYHYYECMKKPYTAEYFFKWIGPLLKQINGKDSSDSHSCQLQKEKVLLLENKNKIVLLNINDIFYIQFMRKKLLVYTKKDGIIEISQTLEGFIKNTGVDFFLRCHKSFAINCKNIIKLEKQERRIWNAFFDYHTKLSCPVSATYVEIVKNKIIECSCSNIT